MAIRRRRKRGSMSDLKGVALAVLGIGIAGGLIVSRELLKPAPRDEDTLCLVATPGSASAESESAQRVVIVDKSDKWTDAQGQRVRSVILRIRDEMRANERLSIFVFNSAVDYGFTPVFSLCNPGRGADVNFISSNPRRWEKRFLEKFGAPLEGILADLVRAEDGEYSPILEVIADVSNRSEFVQGRGEKHLVIISDMLQNSSVFTFFPKPAPAAKTAPPSGANGSTTETSRTAATPPPVRMPTKTEATALAMRVGGLSHLAKYKIRAYQVKGKYPEWRLRMAREFWNGVAASVGVSIDWQIL